MAKTINVSIFLIGALLLPSSVYPKSISTSNFDPERKIDPELQQTIDTLITSVFLPTAEVTGLGLAIVKDDGDLLYTTGYGMSNIGKGYQNSNKTQYGMGSLTKGFTSILVIKLLHEKFPELGAASLDIPINKLIPGANLTLIDRMRSDHTTFRDLLAHLTCVEETAITAEPFSSRDEMIYRTRYLRTTIPEPRTELCYSNIMYAVAGEVASLLGGKPYEALMQEIFDDLGMHDTTFVHRSDNITEMPQRAIPYYVKDRESHLFNPELLKRGEFLNAAGGMISTPTDMTRYLRFMINGGSLDGKVIIPEEVMNWLKKISIGMPQIGFKQSDEDQDLPYVNYGYGLGFQLSLYDGYEEVEHNGNLPPYSGHMAVFPAKKLGIYSAGHQFPPKLPLALIPMIVFEILKGTPNAKENALKIIEKVKANEVAKAKMAEEDWHKYYDELVKISRSQSGINAVKLGKYGNGASGELELSERVNPETNQTQLFMAYGKWYHGWLTPVPNEPTLYEIHYITDVVQDDYLVGLEDGMNLNFANIPGDDTMTFSNLFGTSGVYTFGETLESLPVIPWDPNSC